MHTLWTQSTSQSFFDHFTHSTTCMHVLPQKGTIFLVFCARKKVKNESGILNLIAEKPTYQATLCHIPKYIKLNFHYHNNSILSVFIHFVLQNNNLSVHIRTEWHTLWCDFNVVFDFLMSEVPLFIYVLPQFDVNGNPRSDLLWRFLPLI